MWRRIGTRQAHAALGIHAETGLTDWDGDPVDYGACVEVVCTADDAAAACEATPRRAPFSTLELDEDLDDGPTDGEQTRRGLLRAGREADLDLPAAMWLAKHHVRV